MAMPAAEKVIVVDADAKSGRGDELDDLPVADGTAHQIGVGVSRADGVVMTRNAGGDVGVEGQMSVPAALDATKQVAAAPSSPARAATAPLSYDACRTAEIDSPSRQNVADGCRAAEFSSVPLPRQNLQPIFESSDATALGPHAVAGAHQVTPPPSAEHHPSMAMSAPRRLMRNGPSMEDVIAFGGVQPMNGVRSSGRLQAQPNADATQMDRVMALAQRRNDLQCQGYSYGGALDPNMVLLTPGGSAGAYGYWMQPAADGCTGLLFPGYWVASQ